MKGSVALALLAALGSVASAQTLISADFDAPTYTAGMSVVGQDGWAAGSASGSTQTVSASTAFSGTQSLLFTNLANASASFYSVRKEFTPVAGTAYTASTKLRITGGTGTNRLYGIFLSTGTLGGTYLGATISGGGAIRSGKTWAETNSGAADATAALGTFTNRWLDLSLEVSGTGTGTVTLSGFSDASTYSFNFTGVSYGTTNYLNVGTDFSVGNTHFGSAAFDNVRLAPTSAVPEPATFAALGLGALALIKRRRRS